MLSVADVILNDIDATQSTNKALARFPMSLVKGGSPASALPREGNIVLAKLQLMSMDKASKYLFIKSYYVSPVVIYMLIALWQGESIYLRELAIVNQQII
jgi:hypothetical protein